MNSLRCFDSDTARPVLLLVVRIAAVLILIIFGPPKMMGFGGMIQYIASLGAPMPMLTAIITVVMEIPTTMLIVPGFFIRPPAVLFIFHMLGTAVISHHYQDMTGDAVGPNMINFWKNVNVAGIFLLLAITRPGAISLNRRQEGRRIRRGHLIRPTASTPIVGLIRHSKRRIRHRAPSTTKSKLLRRPVHPTFYKLQQHDPQRHF